MRAPQHEGEEVNPHAEVRALASLEALPQIKKQTEACFLKISIPKLKPPQLLAHP